jgi:hypothetical protein
MNWDVEKVKDQILHSGRFAILEGSGSSRKPVEERGKFTPFYNTFGRWL